MCDSALYLTVQAAETSSSGEQSQLESILAHIPRGTTKSACAPSDSESSMASSPARTNSTIELNTPTTLGASTSWASSIMSSYSANPNRLTWRCSLAKSTTFETDSLMPQPGLTDQRTWTGRRAVRATGRRIQCPHLYPTLNDPPSDPGRSLGRPRPPPPG